MSNLGKKELAYYSSRFFILVVLMLMVSSTAAFAQFFPTGDALAPLVYGGDEDVLPLPEFEDGNVETYIQVVDEDIVEVDRTRSLSERQKRQDTLSDNTKRIIEDVQRNDRSSPRRVTRTSPVVETNVQKITKTVQRQQERKKAADTEKQEYEVIKDQFIESNRQKAKELVPTPDLNEIYSPINTFLSTVVSDVMRFGQTIGLSVSNLPQLNTVIPDPYDTLQQCSSSVCDVIVGVKNSYPAPGGPPGDSYTFVEVSLYEPQSQFSFGWSEWIKVFDIEELSPGRFEVHLPESLLGHVQAINFKAANFVNGNTYYSNNLRVVIVGVPAVPFISSFTYEPADNPTMLYMVGTNFYPQLNVGSPGSYFGVLFYGDMVGGVFQNAKILDYEYLSKKLVRVDVENLPTQYPFSVVMTTANKNYVGLYSVSKSKVVPPITSSAGEVCNNLIDDDGDGLVDCEDPECDGRMGIAGVCEFGTEMTCNDLFDNDADGPYDCSDPDCVGTASCGGAGGETVCNNLIDDDGDGFIDCEDSDCDGQVGTLESGLLCEYGTEVTCDDLFDNDADTFVDCSDSDCEGTPACLTAEICTNGIDDDGDGLIDCQDPDCNQHPLCGGVTTDICTGYFTGNMNKPGTYPTYNSLFQQSWTFRRDFGNIPSSQIINVGGATPDYTSLETAYKNAQCGKTILVHALTGSELNGFNFLNKYCALSPIHVYFVNPTVVTHKASNAGDTMLFNNVEGLVVDGMNNLKIVTAPGAKPRANMFIGAMNGNKPKYDQTVKLIIKNLDIDGGYHKKGDVGSKWGILGEDNTDIGFCNLNVHNVWQEHAFYFHHIAGNFEVVETTMDDLGRSCIQIRADHKPAGNAKYIMANNVCTNSCEAQAFKADDPSGTWWIHGNVAAHNTQGFVSTDSTQGTWYNHQDGRVYVYDNKIWMGNNPKRKAYGYCDDIKQHVLIKDGGAQYFIENNVFLLTNGGINFNTKKYVSSNWPGHYESTFESFDNNIYGFGHPNHPQNYNANERIARWEWPSGNNPTMLSITQWQQVNNGVNKPKAYGKNSQYVFGTANINNMKNTYFSGV